MQKCSYEKRNMRVLMVTTVSTTAGAFLFPYADYLRSNGWGVDLATSSISKTDVIKEHFDSTIALPWTRCNLKINALYQSWKILRIAIKTGYYDIIHTHTPIASFITRLARIGITRENRTKIVYTAHGFHFHKNGRLFWNELFKILEKLAGRWTDILIVINKEDKIAAEKANLLQGRPIILVPGIGIDLSVYDRNRFSAKQVRQRRELLGIRDNDVALLVVAEFNPGKRHKDLLYAVVKCNILNIHIIFAGDGPLLSDTRDLAVLLGLESRCHFLGIVDDVPLLCVAAQIMILPSEREGLPRAVMEAMASGLPVIGADSRGIRDLLDDGCGLLYKVGDADALASKICRIIKQPETSRVIVQNALRKITKYNIEPLVKRNVEIYDWLMAGRGAGCELLNDKDTKENVGYSKLPCNVLVIGGVARSFVTFRASLVKALSDTGNKLILAASDDDKVSQNILVSLGYSYEHISMKRTEISPMGDVSYILGIRKVLKKEDIDVIIAYTHKPILYASFAAKLEKDRNIRMFALMTGLGYAFTEYEKYDVKKWFTKASLSLMYKHFCKHISGVIFQNSDDQSLFLKNKLIRRNMPQVVVRGSGIELDEFPLEPVPDNKVSFLLIARLILEKGIFEWVEACRRIKIKYSYVEFHLVGPFDNHPKSISQKQVNAWIGEGILNYHGANDDVRPFLRECTVFTLPSYREGTPRTVLEAMSTGRAVITTDTPGCRETVFDAVEVCPNGVKQGKNGFLVPIRSVDALVDAMEIAICDKALVCKMGKESRRLAEKYYDANNVTDRMLNFMDFDRESCAEG